MKRFCWDCHRLLVSRHARRCPACAKAHTAKHKLEQQRERRRFIDELRAEIDGVAPPKVEAKVALVSPRWSVVRGLAAGKTPKQLCEAGYPTEFVYEVAAEEFSLIKFIIIHGVNQQVKAAALRRWGQ